MRRLPWLFAVLLSLAIGPPGHAQTKAPAPARGPRFEAVTFGVRHRVFPDFRDVQRVKLNQEFPLGDTEYSARVMRYVPDFQMDLEHRRVFSLSNQPRNPAFQVVVKKNGVPHDTSWAFLKSPPHFGVRAYFAFHVLRIDFVGRAPLLADTTSTPTGMPRPAAAPATKDSASSR